MFCFCLESPELGAGGALGRKAAVPSRRPDHKVCTGQRSQGAQGMRSAELGASGFTVRSAPRTCDSRRGGQLWAGFLRRRRQTGAGNEHRAADAQAGQQSHRADERAAAEGPAEQALDRWTEVWAPTLSSKEIPGPWWEQLVLGTPGRCQRPHFINADSETRIGHCLQQSRAGARLCLSS